MKGRGIPAAVASAGLIALVAIGAHGAPAGKKDEGPFKRGLVGRRAYRLYVPPRPPTESLPLVVALHGCWQTPEDFAQGTRLNEAAERRGFLALYPAQSRWDNPSRCWNWFDPAQQSRRSGEVADLVALVDAVGREREAPPKRVVAIGFSAGAFMAVNLLCAAPELISGVGVVAGGAYRCGLGPDGALACMRGHRLARPRPAPPRPRGPQRNRPHPRFSAGALVSDGPPRRQRRLALGVLLAAAVLAVAVFPLRGTWWGGWILAIAEAGIVGGLADWFAVTAIFRRPLGLPIPHTALIPANWELMAARVGTMVGSRVLTKEYVAQEVARVDVASMIAPAVERLTTPDLDTATRELARWLAAELSPKAAGDLVTRLRDLLLDRPLAPTLAAALELARRHGWDQRLVTGLAGALAEALDRPALRSTVGELGDDLLVPYRARLGAYPRFWIGVASLLGLIDRDRVLGALQAGLRQVVQDSDHPLRQRLAETVAELPERLRADRPPAPRGEAAQCELLPNPVATRVLEDAAAALHRTVLADLERPRSEVRLWIVERLERARRALAGDEDLRRQLHPWVKARVIEVIERHHQRLAEFLQNGVPAPRARGAGGLNEGHAGDDLQYIRVNGTVVGGLAGGLLYAVHLLLRLL